MFLMQADRSHVQIPAVTQQKVGVHCELFMFCTYALISQPYSQDQRGILHHLCLCLPFMKTAMPAMHVMKANRRCNKV